jgi:hypothetical protein
VENTPKQITKLYINGEKREKKVIKSKKMQVNNQNTGEQKIFGRNSFKIQQKS